MQHQSTIAVPADRRVLEPHAYHMVGEKYLRALIDAADAFPVIVPALTSDSFVDSVLARSDGVFLTGSYSNMEPHRYEGEPSAPGTLHDAARDSVTLPLAKRALETGVPLLAVCRGCQELNVALGGTLHQDLATVAGYNNHLEDKSDPLEVQYGPSHPVTLVEGGVLRGLAGTDWVTVNSLHAQGVAKLAPGATVEAVADDGLIEAFRMADVAAFNLAVQWHPEWQVCENEFSLAIFRAFGEACKLRAQQRQVSFE